MNNAQKKKKMAGSDPGDDVYAHCTAFNSEGTTNNVVAGTPVTFRLVQQHAAHLELNQYRLTHSHS